MFYDGGYMGGMHTWWWLFWVVLIGISLYSFRGRSLPRGSGRRDDPKTILQRRLAAGEITPQQYEERKALLDRDADPRETA
jgi:putative membrane protein